MRPKRMGWWVIGCVLAVLVAPVASGAPLRILVTNDDGWDSPGIVAVADALRAAGHEVVVVAPLDQQSGSGMKVTLGELAVVEQRPGVWSVAGSPADAVAVGLARVMHEAPPDLVISGANFGQNLGHNVMLSGTVGAAMLAVLRGVPAIAVSVGLDLAERTTTPPHASTLAAFPGAATLTTRVVEGLARHRGGQLLPPQQVLNINYPARPAGERPQGVVWARTSAHGGFALDYVAQPDGRVKAVLSHDAAGQAETVTDTGRFAAGYVTLSILHPDWNADAANAAAVRARVADGSLLDP